MTTENIIKVDNIAELSAHNINRIVAAIGIFDGIHLGHRKLINQLLEMSERLKAVPVLITFYPHPRKVLMHQPDLKFLRCKKFQAKILAQLGIKAIITIPFTEQFAELSHIDFIKSITCNPDIDLQGICVGSNWKFGAKGKGDKTFLEQASKEFNFEFSPVYEFLLNDRIVSSSTIRNALMQGNFDLAEEMLGAKYIMDGHIINSCNEQEKTTIECLLDHGLLPPAGHYEGDIHIDHKKYPAIIKVQDKNIHDLKLTAFITTKDTININAPLALRFIKAAGNFQTGSAADCRM